MLRALRIAAGAVLILIGIAVVIYGTYVGLKTGRQDYETALLCGVGGLSAIALGIRLTGVLLD